MTTTPPQLPFYAFWAILSKHRTLLLCVLIKVLNDNEMLFRIKVLI